MQILKAAPTIISPDCGATVWAFLAVVAVLSAHAAGGHCMGPTFPRQEHSDEFADADRQGTHRRAHQDPIIMEDSL